MSAYHCSCGFAIDTSAEFGDHFFKVFDRADDTGTDGHMHAEITPDDGPGSQLACACGFEADSGPEFDDHMLLVLIPPDSIGNDGEKHVPVDPSTPDRWHIRDNPRDD